MKIFENVWFKKYFLIINNYTSELVTAGRIENYIFVYKMLITILSIGMYYNTIKYLDGTYKQFIL